MDKLIIVEDERWEREGLAEFLDWPAMDIRFMGAAANGLEGIALARSVQPDLLLTDIRMPQMDGLSLARQARRELPACMVLLLTGYDDFSYAQDAIRQGVFDYLLKPVQRDQLGDALTRAKHALARQRESRGRSQGLPNDWASRQTDWVHFFWSGLGPISRMP